MPAGILAVVRSNKAQDRPYTGLTEIKSGEVAEDLAAYLANSEQANAALALGVSIHRNAAVRAAGGYLIQVGWHSGRELSPVEHQGTPWREALSMATAVWQCRGVRAVFAGAVIHF